MVPWGTTPHPHDAPAPMTILFYKSTRPQAPARSKTPALRDLVECSACRGVYFPDTKEAKANHRAWHAKTPGATAPAPDQYVYPRACSLCGEDLCGQPHPEATCRVLQQVNTLLDAGRDAEAEALADTLHTLPE